MAKKKNKNLLPKKIAGVKVPKSVRKGRFGELLASPAGQALLAEAVLAVGAVATAKTAADPETGDKFAKVADKLRGAGHSAGQTTTAASGALAYALGEAVRSFAEALQHHSDAHDGGASGQHPAAPSGAAEGSKKKSISSEAAPH